MPQRHLHLESFKLFGHTSLRLCAHLLPRPLLYPVEFLVDIHLAVVRASGLSWSLDEVPIVCKCSSERLAVLLVR
jgi:hypothetical protein